MADAVKEHREMIESISMPAKPTTLFKSSVVTRWVGMSTKWAGQWSEAQILAGRKDEERRRNEHYAQRDQERKWWVRGWKWLTRSR